MNLRARRREVLFASARLQLERDQWMRQTQSLRTRVAAHREWWILSSGLAGGLIAGLLPLHGFRGAGRLASRTLSFVLRSPLIALLFASAATKSDPAKPDPPP